MEPTTFLGYIVAGCCGILLHSSGFSDSDGGQNLRQSANDRRLPTTPVLRAITYKSLYQLTTYESHLKNEYSCFESAPFNDRENPGVEKVDWEPCYSPDNKDFAQIWQLLPERVGGPGFFKLKNTLTGKCLQVGNMLNADANMTPLIQAPCDDVTGFALNQAFYQYKSKKFDYTGNYYQYRHAGSDKCISAPTKIGMSPYIYDCADIYNSQWFRFLPNGEAPLSSPAPTANNRTYPEGHQLQTPESRRLPQALVDYGEVLLKLRHQSGDPNKWCIKSAPSYVDRNPDAITVSLGECSKTATMTVWRTEFDARREFFRMRHLGTGKCLQVGGPGWTSFGEGTGVNLYPCLEEMTTSSAQILHETDRYSENIGAGIVKTYSMLYFKMDKNRCLSSDAPSDPTNSRAYASNCYNGRERDSQWWEFIHVN